MKRQLQDISNREGQCCYEGKEMRSPEVRRRRVEMEKRRRDKINYYLNELADLVPAAAEKRGSSKLEKAEVLELTLDHVRKVVHEKNQEKDRKCENGGESAEKERRRGFLACLQHISRFLEKSESLLESNEKLIFCLKDFLSGQKVSGDEAPIPENRAEIYDSYYTKRCENVDSNQYTMTHENVFYKICLDFLKNNSYAQPSEASEDNLKQRDRILDDDYSSWQDVAGSQDQLTLSCENLDSSYDLTLPCCSFMSLLNGYY